MTFTFHSFDPAVAANGWFDARPQSVSPTLGLGADLQCLLYALSPTAAMGFELWKYFPGGKGYGRPQTFQHVDENLSNPPVAGLCKTHEHR